MVVGEAVQQRQPLQNATGASNVIIGLISSLSKGERPAASVVPKENNTDEKVGVDRYVLRSIFHRLLRHLWSLAKPRRRRAWQANLVRMFTRKH